MIIVISLLKLLLIFLGGFWEFDWFFESYKQKKKISNKYSEILFCTLKQKSGIWLSISWFFRPQVLRNPAASKLEAYSIVADYLENLIQDPTLKG